MNASNKLKKARTTSDPEYEQRSEPSVSMKSEKQIEYDSIYVVQKGDNMKKLAYLFKTNEKILMRLNDLPAINCTLVEGQCLLVLNRSDKEKNPEL